MGRLLTLLRRRRVSGGSAFPTGMAARWTLDDTSAGYVDLIGGLTLTAGGTSPTSAAGLIGNAAEVGGSGWLITPDATALQATPGFAVEIWARLTTPSTFQILASKGGGGGPEWKVGIVGSRIYGELYNTIGGAVFPEGTTTVTADTWTHFVAAVTSDQRLRLYLNGALEATSTALAGTLANTGSLNLGRDSGGPAQVTGRLDEPAIWQFGGSGDPGAAFWTARYNGGLGRRP